MAVAQSEARRQLEEWDSRERKRLWELEQERAELLRRGEQRQRMQQEMHARAMQAQDEAAQQQQQQQQHHTPVVVKRSSAAAIGSRPSLSLRRSAQSSDAGFVTPAAKPRRRPDNTSEVRKRAQAAVEEKERVERTEARTSELSEEEEEEMQDEASAHESVLDVNEDEQADDEVHEAEENETAGDQMEHEERQDSDTEDEEQDDPRYDEPVTEVKVENEARLSPIKKRTSNRIYTAPPRSTSTASATSALTSASAALLPPTPAGLKPDMSLTRWYFHIQQHNPPNPPRITIKGTHATEGAWSSGYVLDRERTTGRVLLTSSRRYVLHSDMDAVEMEREGWSERMRRACLDGLPVEWRDWLVREGEQRLQDQREKEAKRVSFDFADTEEKEEHEPIADKVQDEEKEEEEHEPTSHKRLSPLIRARRSPAPVRHSEWWEDELMRLVEAVSVQTADTDNDSRISHSASSSDIVELWKRVAEEVGGGRRWEDCKRKFEEVKQEQSKSIKETEKKMEKEKRFDERREERKSQEKQNASSSKKTDKKESSHQQKPAISLHKTNKRSLITPAAAISSESTSEKKTVSKDKADRKKPRQQEKAAVVADDEKGQITNSSTVKKRTIKPKPPSTTLLSSISLPTPAPPAASVEHAVINPHDMAYTHTRRSGRAVMAPLKHWELEREVNGVILRGFQHGGEAIRRVLTEKEQMERHTHNTHTVPAQHYTEAKGRLAGQGGVKKKLWSSDEREQLRLAYMWVEPSERGFWVSVSRFMAGRTADECQAEYDKLFPTPKRRGKRKANDTQHDNEHAEAEDEAKDDAKNQDEEGEEEGGARPKKRKRQTTIKREIRQALDSRQQQHSGDDLFDSTPYKHNTDLTHTIQPHTTTHHTKRPQPQTHSPDAQETGGSLLFAGDPALADLHVQRITKERRRARAHKGKAVQAEKRRQGAAEERSRLGERVAEGVSEMRLGVRRLEDEDEERKQALMDEMDDEVEVGETDEDEQGNV